MNQLKQIIFSLTVLGLVIVGGSVDSYAAVSASDEIQQEFEQKMGRSWYAASDKEQKIFIRSRELIKQRKSGRSKNQKKSRIRISGGYEGASLAVRYNFEKQGKGSWDDASEEEQEAFKKKYLKGIKRQNELEKKSDDQKKRQEEMLKRKFEEKKKYEERRKQLKIKKAKRKADEVRKKREASQKKIEAAKERIRRMRERAKRK